MFIMLVRDSLQNPKNNIVNKLEFETFEEARVFKAQQDKIDQINVYEIEVPEDVKKSRFGCANCLWASCECQHGCMYKPKEFINECSAYVYHD